MTSESDMRAAGAFAAEDFAAEDFAAEDFAADGFDFAFFGVEAFDADVLSAAGFEAFAAGCAAAFFTGFFMGMRFSETTGFKTYTVLP